MMQADLTQSLILGVSKMLLTPILKHGNFNNYFDHVVDMHNFGSAVGAAASDYFAQSVIDSVENSLPMSIKNSLQNMSGNNVSLGQSVLTGGVYVLGDYIGEEFDLFKGGSRSYKYFPFKYNYLTEGIYIALLDSLAQVSTPHAWNGKRNNLGKSTMVDVNNVGTPAPVNTTVLKSGQKQPKPVPSQNPSARKAHSGSSLKKTA